MKDAFVVVKYQEIKIKLDRTDLSLREELGNYLMGVTKDVYELADKLIGWFDREAMLVLTLNIKNEIVGYAIAHIGTTNQAIASAKDIFKYAIITNADAIILVHNHPSGNSLPSKADDKFTIQMEEASKVIGIKMLDHIIIGEKEFYSYQEGRRRIL